MVLLFTGFYLIHLYGGMGNVGRHVHIMLLMGMVMILIFIYVYFAGYRSLRKYVADQRWKEAGESLAKIRSLIAVNLSLGILLVCEVFIVPALF